MRTPIFRFPAATVILLACGAGFPPVTQAETKDKSHPEKKAPSKVAGTAKPGKNSKPEGQAGAGAHKPVAIAPTPEAVPPPPLIRTPAHGNETEQEKETPVSPPVAEAPVETGDSSAEDQDPDKEEKEEGGNSPFHHSKEAASRTKLDAMLPPGSTHRGVYYPSFRPVQPDSDQPDSAAGALPGMEETLASVFRGESVTRLDNDHVEVTQANWVQYDETPRADGTPRPAMTLDLERGVYNLKTQILISNQPVRIENSGRVMLGDTMLHDRASGLTTLEGRVRIVFFDEEESPATAPKAEKAQPVSTIPAPAAGN
ncbi:MAG: hypothetical protein EOP86_07055 [Verrucomicrobiaceae bacterium]|nr:MAG: hypothetical protein EOP86_07055 [Verrucomicrobiaceae bacterium]